MTPNWFATIALLSWPFVAACLYSTLSFGRATLWTILAAQLLLPVGYGIKFEMIPQFDKTSIPNLCILGGCILVGQGRTALVKGTKITTLLILVYLVGPIITSELNGDQVIYGNVVLPGVGLYDAISAVEAAVITLLPFFIGWRFLWHSNDNRGICQILVTAQLAYSILLLFEIRFSPQLHYWIYGYYPSEFLQSMRDGGFRPMAFMGHGLTAAQFMMMAIVASAALWRTRTPFYGFPVGGITAYLSAVLLLCKSLGAALYSIVLAPLVYFAKPTTQMRIASVLVFIALLYPTLRTFDLFPTDLIVSAASHLSTARAESLKFRFDNENQLLARAFERPAFGWGRFGRSRVYNQWGKDVSTTDGRWIITLGQFGLFGFIGEFGLLALVVFRASTALKYARTMNDKIFLSALALIVAVDIIDLIPNSGLTPWVWLMTGALLGRAEALRSLANRSSKENQIALINQRARRIAF
jgi:hypothetical protein